MIKCSDGISPIRNFLFFYRNISNRIFCSDVVPALTDLYLANNQLYDLNFHFECIEHLRFLDVSYNKIKRLNSATMSRINEVFKTPQNSSDKISKISLIGNPYVCDCNLRPMFDWLQNSQANLYRREEMRCFKGIPEMNSGRRILNVQQLQCLDANQQPVDTYYHHYHQAHVSSGITQTLLIILIILVLVLLLALLYIHKERVHRNVKPLLDNFQRSLQYRTIEKDLATNDQNLPEVNV